MKRKFYHFGKIQSTNTFLKDNINNFEKDFLHIAVADEQVQGRGRQKRVWVSPKGNLYLSFAYFLPYPVTDSVGTILAMAACQSIQTFGLSPQLKWPNDIRIGKKKVAGILGESVVDAKGQWTVLGIGINVDQAPLLETICLKDVLQKQIILRPFTHQVIDAFDEALTLYKDQGFVPFQKIWEGFCCHQLGERLSMETIQGKISGRYAGINANGALLLKDDSGEILSIFSGEIL